MAENTTTLEGGPSCTTTRASFPLFQMIYDQFDHDTTTPPTVSMKNTICRVIRDMDDYHMELIYAIIRCYHLQIDERPIFENPYYMKKIKPHHYRFEVDHLPDHLVHILYRFVDMYTTNKDHLTTTTPHDPCDDRPDCSNVSSQIESRR